jgi:hypothetical protein
MINPVLAVISSSESDPVGKLKELTAKGNLPKVYQSSFLDPELFNFCLYLHDASDGSQIKLNIVNESNAHIAQIKALMPVTVLTINSRQYEAGSVAVVPDIWAPYSAPSEILKASSEGNISSSPDLLHFRARANSLSEQFRGHLLSESDFSNVTVFMNEFLAPIVFRNLVSKIIIWEKDVASHKRGISNRLLKVGLKYFGSTKPSTSVSASPVFSSELNRIVFPHNSNEMIMRRLADYAFMVRDYKYAQGILQIVKKDFEANKKYAKFLGGVLVNPY